MKSLVEFKSAMFPAYASEAEEINPGRYGKRLAEYLERRLPEFGIAVGSIVAEDWVLRSDPEIRDVRWWSEEEAGA